MRSSGKVLLVDRENVYGMQDEVQEGYYDGDDISELSIEEQLERIEAEIDVIMADYIRLFAELAEERCYDSSDGLRAQEDVKDSFISRLEDFRDKINQPHGKPEKLIREYDRLTAQLAAEWDALPEKLDFILQQEFDQIELTERKALQEEELEAGEIVALTQAVTFTSDVHARSRALDAANPSRLASQQHRSDKLAVISEHREKYPDESSPMYTEQRFFKQKEERPARSHARHQLLGDEMDAYLSMEKDRRDEQNRAWEDEMETRLDELSGPRF